MLEAAWALKIGGVHAYEARLRLGNTGLRSLGLVHWVSFAGRGSLGLVRLPTRTPSINTRSVGTYNTVEARHAAWDADTLPDGAYNLRI